MQVLHHLNKGLEFLAILVPWRSWNQSPWVLMTVKYTAAIYKSDQGIFSDFDFSIDVCSNLFSSIYLVFILLASCLDFSLSVHPFN